MKALGPLLTLIFGVLILVGLLLPWINFTVTDVDNGQFLSLSINVSGWDFISHSRFGGDLFASIFTLGLSSVAEWLVLIGSILMILSSLVALLIRLLTGRSKAIALILGATASIGAGMAIMGTLKYLLADMDVLSLCPMGAELTGKGVYIATAFAFLGLACALITFFQARSSLDLIEISSDTGNSPVADNRSIRKYYEEKATTYATPSTPVEEKTNISVMPPVPPAIPLVAATATATPLPPLPPTIDDAAAQQCFAQAAELENAEERDKAIEQYTKAIRLNSKYTMAYFKRGMLLMGIGFKPAAIADFRRVIDISDNEDLINAAKENIAKIC